MPKPIRIALVGTGAFARDAHVPALTALGDQFQIAAVYSRTQANAEALVPLIPGQPDTYTNLDAMLQRDDIEAVDLILPIEILPEAIEKSLRAGKHVVSEKPITPDVITGQRLIQYAQQYSRRVWMVAENWRYEDAFRRAEEVVSSGALGQIIVAHWALHLPTRPGNKYYETSWRRSGTFPGGFLLDGGVHHVAAFRQVLGEITHVSAAHKQILPDLPPADTMSAVMEFASGVIGGYTVTYAAGAPFGTYLTVIGDQGVLRVSPGHLETTLEGSTRSEDVGEVDDVQAELAAFGAAIREGQPHRNTPLEALHDVAVIEAMLKSAETGRRIEVATFPELEHSHE